MTDEDDIGEEEYAAILAHLQMRLRQYDYGDVAAIDAYLDDFPEVEGKVSSAVLLQKMIKALATEIRGNSRETYDRAMKNIRTVLTESDQDYPERAIVETFGEGQIAVIDLSQAPSCAATLNDLERLGEYIRALPNGTDFDPQGPED